MKKIKVIDLFAGPGGLGEGFSQFKKNNSNFFDVKLSIEKDSVACKTLLTRKFYRKIQNENSKSNYNKYINGNISIDNLFQLNQTEFKEARKEVLELDICKKNRKELDTKIQSALNGDKKWVLIGGPPCQAYSIAGRTRILGKKPLKDEEKYRKDANQYKKDLEIYNKKLNEFSKDERHELYTEYIRIISKFSPSIFIMENVQGILSSTIKPGKHEKIINRIMEDLKSPNSVTKSKNKTTYNLFPLVKSESKLNEFSPKDFLINSEDYGVPQTRKRVIIVGYRNDLIKKDNLFLKKEKMQDLKSTIDDLPKMRSIITNRGKVNDNLNRWIKEISNSFKNIHIKDKEFKKFVKENIKKLSDSKDYFENKANKMIPNHETRMHLIKDIQRYFYSSCFSRFYERSPKIEDFPINLIPKHKNINKNNLKNTIFKDRFRVQLENDPSKTITSHISKDGHYFIHYDPLQSRSFSVREAARVQTFPDNYFFEGNKTQQYVQVGNAVPPLLAQKIASIVAENLDSN
tara:strand:+ start:726 stop:2279 length:1554 start_codon:yes stop_codon:yes gene_type:complete